MPLRNFFEHHVQLTDHLFHATQAARALIARKALEELAGNRPLRRVKVDRDRSPKRGPAGSSRRWKIDLSYPAPPLWRPATPEGATSFHFALSSVSKAQPANAKAGNGAANAALRFERYVTALSPEVENRATGAERYVVDGHDTVAGASRTTFVISNISSDPHEREAFWAAVNDAASTPSRPRLEIRPDCGDLADLIGLADEPGVPKTVGRALRKLAKTLADEPAEAAKRVHCIDLDDTGLAWADGLADDRFGTRRDERLVHVVRPRGGVLQWQIEAEFPAELDGDDDRAIAEDYARMLDGLGLSYTIAAHDPTHRNDLRNRHPHILIYPGVCHLRDDGSWAFGRKVQPGVIAVRLGELGAGSLARIGFRQRSAADVTALRRRYAEIINARLAARGVRRRYDPRSYEQMGIDQAPGEHLGSAAAALVGAGYAVEIDQRNAVKGWAGRERRAAQDIAVERKRYEDLADQIDTADPVGDDPILAPLRSRLIDLAEELMRTREMLAAYDLHDAMARSAAERLNAKTTDILAAIENGTAKASEAEAAATYRARNEIAAAHLEAIDEALAPHAGSIRAARQDIASLRADLRELERQISATMEQRAHAAAAARQAEEWAAGTVLMPARHPAPLTPDAHFDALVEHLRNQRKTEWATPQDRFVHVSRVADGGDRFVSAGLQAADGELVEKQPYRRRFEGVLREAGKLQEGEISRVLAYISAHGEAALLTDAPSDVQRTVRRHYQLYRHHPTFCRLVPEARTRFDAARAAAQEMEDSATTPEREGVSAVVRAPTVALSTVTERGASHALTGSKGSLQATIEDLRSAGSATSEGASDQPSLRASENPGHSTASVPKTRSDGMGAAQPSTSSNDTVSASKRQTGVPARASVRDQNGHLTPPAVMPDEADPDASGSSMSDGLTRGNRPAETRPPEPPLSPQVEKGHSKSIGRLREVIRERSGRRAMQELGSSPTEVDEAPSSAGTVAGADLRGDHEAATPGLVAGAPDVPPGIPRTAFSTTQEAFEAPAVDNGMGISSNVTTPSKAAVTARPPDAIDAPPANARPSAAPPRQAPLPGNRASPTEEVRDIVRGRTKSSRTDVPEPSSTPAEAGVRVVQNPPDLERVEARRNALAIVRRFINRFRDNPLYVRLTDRERAAFDNALQVPLNDIVAGRASLRIAGGELLAATASQRERKAIDELASSECGFWLLVHLASEPLPARAGLGTWHVVDQACDTSASTLARKEREIGG